MPLPVALHNKICALLWQEATVRGLGRVAPEQLGNAGRGGFEFDFYRLVWNCLEVEKRNVLQYRVVTGGLEPHRAVLEAHVRNFAVCLPHFQHIGRIEAPLRFCSRLVHDCTSL
jgi:hypothetical protein